MRTLKKTLCLVLALVMVLGLGAFGVSAIEYEDADDITAGYDEAIQLLGGLGVMQGNNGNFLPGETLDRAAAAVILTKLALGGATVPTMPTTFVDVDEGYAWAENYIGYAQAQGYIKGYNDEYFGPGDKLTGAQWGIMLLRVLGYKDENEDFSSGFELGVAKLVSLTKLAAGDDGYDPTKPITREEVAQLAFNSLSVPMVDYEDKLSSSDGQLTTTAKRIAADGDPYLAESFGLTVNKNASAGTFTKDAISNDNIKYGVVVDNSAVTNGSKTTTISTDAGETTVVLKTASADELLGHYVKAYVKGSAPYTVLSVEDVSTEVPVTAAISTAAKWTAAFGSGITKATKVAEFSAAGELSDGAATLTDGTTAPKGTYYVYDGKIVSRVIAPAYDVKDVTVTLAKAGSSYYTAATAGDTYATATSSATTNYVVYDGTIDWTSYVTTGTTGHAMFLVAPYGDNFLFKDVQTVEGAVTRINKTAGSEAITVDGTAYGYADDANFNGIIGETALDHVYDVVIGKTYTFYVDESGKLFAASGDAAVAPEYELIYVVGTKKGDAAKNEYGETGTAPYFVQYYKLDGSVNITEIDYVAVNDATAEEVDDTEFAKINATVTTGEWALLSTNADDEITITTLDYAGNNVNTATGYYPIAPYDIAANQVNMSTASAVNGILTTSKSVYMYGTANTFDSAANKAVTPYTGAHTSTIGDGVDGPDKIMIVAVENASNSSKKDIVAMWVNAGVSGQTTDAELFYVAAYNGQVSAAVPGDATTANTYEYTVYDLEGETSTIVTKDASGFVGKFVIVSEGTDGFNSFVDQTTALGSATSGNHSLALNGKKAADVYTVDGKTFINATSDYDMTNAVIIDTVNSSSKVSTVAALVENGAYKAVAIYDVDTKVISTIVITGATEYGVTYNMTAVSGYTAGTASDDTATYGANTLSLVIEHTSAFNTEDDKFTVTYTTKVGSADASDPITATVAVETAGQIELSVSVAGVNDDVTVTVTSIKSANASATATNAKLVLTEKAFAGTQTNNGTYATVLTNITPAANATAKLVAAQISEPTIEKIEAAEALTGATATTATTYYLYIVAQDGITFAEYTVTLSE